VRDCSALDAFEEQHGTVSEVIRQQIGTEAHAVVPLMRLRLGEGYYHGPVPDIGHVYHETLAC
jgi:hypothetical protein